MKKQHIFISFLFIFIVTIFNGSIQVFAETAEQSNHTFTQPFQNTATSLTGTAVKATTYFTRIDYWKVKKATFNLSYAITQLANNQTSNLTVAVNGVKFFSWHPENKKGMQQQSIDIPLALIKDNNTLTLEGQIVNQPENDTATLLQTPANWLTIEDNGMNVNFQYDLNLPENTIHSFYNHFKGADTIANNQSIILVPDQATAAELSAATYSLAGISRTMTTSESFLSIDSWHHSHQQPYQIYIGMYNRLPNKYKREISEKGLENEAVLRLFNDNNQHVLVVTSKDEDRLIEAGRYIANSELMTETEKMEKRVTSQTDTYTSSLEFDGNYPLTSTGTYLSGPNHQEQAYFVHLPINHNNVNGSSVTINMKYADNLDFNNSLVTVYVNDRPIGSKKLTNQKANKDKLTVQFPNDLEVNDSFLIKVAFDLNLKDTAGLNNAKTPWAYIENTSKAFIQAEELKDRLFTNYPNVLIQNQTFADLAVILPKKLDKNYFNVLSNLFTLIGKYAQSNVGEINFYKKQPQQQILNDHNLIVIGTPKDNQMIQTLNKDLYFKYTKDFSTFSSNEKLSIEQDYGKEIETAQLLSSSYNTQAVALVLTGADSEAVRLVSTQLNAEKNLSIYKGYAIVIDKNYRRYDYRFKKIAQPKRNKGIVQLITDGQQLLIYGLISLLVLLIIGTSFFFVIRRNRREG
ncbi:hypothetical protein MEPL4_5c01960 [Melissococcus plutonius]|uniref:cellulose biosynthesis cyclic di-GMP-binding regulatory protein BcsB n=1 Tax=Melissococcus plutonius TaxID=33970 RepID=UPI00065E0B92|nr:cellulose biosynthesis cyclic di-GMP-binding regulatory protein BcsB [Melissococcus plutonius]AIM25298.1 hypothetical protein MEPL_c014750 [Melissococcus plutonius S1]KMT23985.1 hypothetical protein MEPL2_3c01970 [Melissococcus plutonius]KMT24139.1 hypothetical protein MEPL3_7c00060 [Melissococcus plutonius]KMT25484.1 hypothetical protein MEPL1_7c00060 [Melissococcus plutonius]KMT28630.1 hypothetical protein MEPL4_5c01960 [Melissococcus plutonius]